MKRRYTLLDKLCIAAGNGLQTVFAVPLSSRQNPADFQEIGTLSDKERDLSARLMRINHTGEVCAQALYQGQALTAQSESVKEKLEHSAQEENDHLNWCANRIKQLDSHLSYLNPLWYCGSFTLGVVAGIAGDKWSLGFLAETEHQVCQHIDKHLAFISPNDGASIAVLKQMRIDEAQHEATAWSEGATDLPQPIKAAMKLTSKLMTNSCYYL